ncbi:alpha-amylase domain-containing protein [Halonatronum saccharophilum]|uniref:alpha-amylase domain-containing protein n=1 Tax=Halonatronum saccharophilum TaxID=150060 RepID=UPI0004B9F340|nr:alpha-amylase domain-containing protein [Halonatronum saccharophilum]
MLKIAKNKLIIVMISMLVLLVVGCSDDSSTNTPDRSKNLILESSTIQDMQEVGFWLDEVVITFNNNLENIEVAGIEGAKGRLDNNKAIIYNLNLDMNNEYTLKYIVRDEYDNEYNDSISFMTSGTNQTMMQAFYWNMAINRNQADGGYYTAYEDYRDLYPEEENLWQLLEDRADYFSEIGITSLWLPPAHKADHPLKVGYATYDIWDLGEFEQEGFEDYPNDWNIRTKHGTREELEGAISTLKDNGIEVYYDVVMNHRMGGNLQQVPLDDDFSNAYRVEGIIELIDEGNSQWKFTFDPTRYEGVPNNISEVHLVGNFGLQGSDLWWNPANKEYLLEEDNGIWTGIFEVQEGTAFKFMYDADNWDDEQHIGVDGTPYGDDFVIEKLIEADQVYAYVDFSGLKGRDNYYSRAKDFEWDWKAFNGTDYFDGLGNVGATLFEGKEWDDAYGDPYLMGADVDYQNPNVQHELKEWGQWIINDIDFDGFRLDAIKHVDTPFVRDWIDYVQDNSEKDVFYIAEAWEREVDGLTGYLDAIEDPQMYAFDFPLREDFMGMSYGNLDMRDLASAGLVNSRYKDQAVTFIDNHDTYRDGDPYGEAVNNFKYQAYTYILTREHGLPTIFWKDYYQDDMKEGIDKLLEVRRDFAYGRGYEVDNNDRTTYSYVREGIEELPESGLVMMITRNTNGNTITKEINSRQPNTLFYDYTGNVEEIIETDNNGYGEFQVQGSEAEGWSVWVPVNN